MLSSVPESKRASKFLCLEYRGRFGMLGSWASDPVENSFCPDVRISVR